MILYNRPLVIHPVGGFGNRMLAIFSGIRELALSRYDMVIIKWNISSDCNIDASDVFTFSDNIIIDTTNKYKTSGTGVYNMILNQSWYDFIATPTLFDSKLPVDVDLIIQWFYDNIHSHITFKLAKPDQDVIGIHCRRGDWGRTDYDCQEVINQEDLEYNHLALNIAFCQYISKYQGERIFLSTDSASTLAYFRHQIGDRLIYNPKVEYNYYTHRTTRSMAEAMNDIACLAACKKIVRDSYSTFSLVASIIGRKPLESWDRPVLQQSGSGFIMPNN